MPIFVNASISASCAMRRLFASVVTSVVIDDDDDEDDSSDAKYNS